MQISVKKKAEFCQKKSDQKCKFLIKKKQTCIKINATGNAKMTVKKCNGKCNACKQMQPEM